ncbi:MAG TPA: phosphoglucosamine mutase [Sandaracinaceae bacterium LLY-WYZ-13_1]|nr:phosphoglucosamine mutase [Sandaracinaceae bacterium LLY-WYZ-13_1]
MARKLFGTDGIRGKANQGNMTPEVAFRIGAGITYQVRQRVSHAPRVVIGKDTRQSGYLLEQALSAGVCAQGGQVLLSGPLPTPAIAHLTTSMRADAGVVISASHNPYPDNGIKIFGADGFKLPDAAEEELEALIDGTSIDERRPTGRNVGRATRLDDAPGRYVAFVKQSFPEDLTLEGLRIVVDAAHGAAYRVAPAVFFELGADVFPIGVRPNGQNINKKAGAVHPQACAREVLKRRAHLGIALDGDADRVIVIDESGERVDGDVVMALCATRMLRARQLRKRTLVTTVMSNLGLEHALASVGGKMVRTKVGDRYVVERMRAKGYNFGGEQSGHMIFLDHASTGDGLVAALQLLAIVLREERPLSELATEAMERVPQVLVNAKLTRRRPLEEMPQTMKAVRRVEKELGRSGRVVIRWSGTEPKLRVMVEGEDEGAIETLAKDIADTAVKEVG